MKKFFGAWVWVLVYLGTQIQPIHAIQNAFRGDGSGQPSDAVTLKNPASFGDRVIRELVWPAKFNIRGRIWQGLASDTRRMVWGQGSSILDIGDSQSLNEIDLSVRKIIRDYREVFQVSDDTLVLNPRESRQFRDIKVLVYNRRVRDLSVKAAELIFQFKRNHLIQINNHTFGAIPQIEPPQLSSEEALQTVQTDAEVQEGEDMVNPHIGLIISPVQDRSGRIHFEPIYQIEVKKRRPIGIWNYEISAVSGRILQLYNKFCFISGQVAAPLRPLLPTDNAVTKPLAGATVSLMSYFFATGKAITGQDGRFEIDGSGRLLEASLRGPHVRVNNRSGSNLLAKADLSKEGEVKLQFEPGDSLLDQTTAFYHVNRIVDIASQYLKLDFFKRPLTVNVNITNDPVFKGCQAFYDGWSLNFFPEVEECRNTGEMPSVIYHEWGHALDDAMDGIDDNAYSEGFADALSSYLVGSPLIGEGFRKTGPVSYLRDVGIPRSYPKDQNQDPHYEGLIFASTAWDVRKAMIEAHGKEVGVQMSLQLLLTHMLTSRYYTDSYNNYLLHDDNDGNLENGTPNLCLLNAVFVSHGLATVDARCN